MATKTWRFFTHEEQQYVLQRGNVTHLIMLLLALSARSPAENLVTALYDLTENGKRDRASWIFGVFTPAIRDIGPPFDVTPGELISNAMAKLIREGILTHDDLHQVISICTAHGERIQLPGIQVS